MNIEVVSLDFKQPNGSACGVTLRKGMRLERAMRAICDRSYLNFNQVIFYEQNSGDILSPHTVCDSLDGSTIIYEDTSQRFRIKSTYSN